MSDLLTPFRLVDTLDTILVVRLTSEERDAVRRIAARNGVTMSAMVRRMLRTYRGDTDGARGDLEHAKLILGMTKSRRKLERQLEKRLTRAHVAKSRK